MSIPHKVDAINGTVKRLKRTLYKPQNSTPKSLRFIISGFVSHSLHHALRGSTEVHPGIKKIASWGQCSERTAQRHMRVLENCGVLVATSNKKGGRLSARYWLDFHQLSRVLIDLEFNPSPEFLTEIRDIQTLIFGVDISNLRGDTRGDTRGDICHPVLRSNTKGAVTTLCSGPEKAGSL